MKTTSPASAQRHPDALRPSRASARSSVGALLHIDSVGTITSTTAAARKLLGYAAEAEIDPCFFTHIHGRFLVQVMHDLAAIVCHGKAGATWLLRMRRADGEWVWLRTQAVGEEPPRDGGGIQIHLEPVDTEA